MLKKRCTLLLAGVLFAFAGYSQIFVDGFDYVFGDRGYTLLGDEYEIPEMIDPEFNNLFPDNPVATPMRQCTTGCGTGAGWNNKGDVDDYFQTGLHPGEDWNYLSGEADSGKVVYATANGLVVGIKVANAAGYINYAGWTVVLKHFLPDGNYYHSIYTHVTSYSSENGDLVYDTAHFTISVGDWVSRGEPIARIGKGFTAPTGKTPISPHLHFEMRDSAYDYVEAGNILFPRDNNKGYYGGDIVCTTPCNLGSGSGVHTTGMTLSQVENAYTNMQLDGIIDASDFIDAHRPSTYSETECTNPPIVWQNTIGGNDIDELYSIDPTNDGGYIAGGVSHSSISGDKNENSIGNSDYWILKLNNIGNIVWQKTIGGSGYDYLYSVEQTSDSGYILGGFSDSGISGDKTEPCLGNYDYWVVKLDSLGNIIWQNTIGGNQPDNLNSIEQTLDGGYILGGTSSSGISGDKTEALIGDAYIDFWVVKLGSDGDIEWQNTIGGNRSDALNYITQTFDGGYVLAGSSNSDISGDKTEAAVNIFDNDYWVVKLNSLGVIEWQNTIAGNSEDELINIQQTTDGGYILGGSSKSTIYGDKTEESMSYDYWVIKLSEEGNIEWQNTIGGNNDDFLRSIEQTTDNGYVIAGSSNSTISGDKTEALISSSDYWIVKLDNNGEVEWDNTIGGNSFDIPNEIHQNTDGSYIVGGTSGSGIYADKTEPLVGVLFDDYWILKLSCEGEPCIPSTELCNGLDDDCDGTVDDGIVETVSITAGGPTTFCQGSSVVLTATYSGTSVQWKKDGVAVSGATSATYTATVKGLYTATTTSSCGTATSSGINVVVNKPPTATITAGGPTTFCAGGSVVLTANSAAGLTYQWYKGSTLISGATSISYTATTSGNFKCAVTKASTGCSKTSSAIAVTAHCKEGEFEDGISLYPNPASNKLYIALESTVFIATDVTIVDAVGNLVWQGSITDDGSLVIDVSKWTSGLYLANFVQEGSAVQTRTFIVE